MAKTLLDTIRESTQQAKTPTIGNEKEQAEQLLVTKSTGLAPIKSSGPATSNQASKLALQSTKEEMGTQALSGRLQDLGQLETLEGQEEQAVRNEAIFKQSLKDMESMFDQRTTEILTGLEQGRDTLREEDRRAQLENLTQMMRLSNKSYVDQLEMAGREKRLRDTIAANEEMARVQLRNSLDFLNQKNAYKKIAGASDREWKQELANIDIAVAMQMAQAAASEANKQAQQEAIGSLFSAGTQAAATIDKQNRQDAMDIRQESADRRELSDAAYEKIYDRKKGDPIE